jgi:calcium-dependent protein kinase
MDRFWGRLCGYPPFYAKTNPELFKKIMACRYDFDDKRWLTISESGAASPLPSPRLLSSPHTIDGYIGADAYTAKDLIGKLLVRDPEQRPSAQQILMHPWITTAELMDGLESSSIDLGSPPPRPRSHAIFICGGLTVWCLQ